MRRSLITDARASSCYFRTAVEGNGRKALVQITERCTLRCAHCFVSATPAGRDMPLDVLVERVIPRLIRARVRRVTLTGGEPFLHPDLVAMCRAMVDAGLPVGICTNATQISDRHLSELAQFRGVHVNVSFDGFRAESHGRFRGDRACFAAAVAGTRKLAEAGLLQGILSTPNTLTDPEEFADLCAFAVELGAAYVLMNPLSPMGRGVGAQRLAAPEATMREIQKLTAGYRRQGLEVIPVRFPNDSKPLGACPAGQIGYVFVNGSVAVCPYLVFAARTPGSRHDPRDFLVGNIIQGDIADALDRFDLFQRYPWLSDTACDPCPLASACGRGCPAAVVAAGGRVGDVDADQCPHPAVDPDSGLQRAGVGR